MKKKKKPTHKFTVTYKFTPKVVADAIIASGIKLPVKINTSRKIANKLKQVIKNKSMNMDSFFSNKEDVSWLILISGALFQDKLEDETNAITGSFDL